MSDNTYIENIQYKDIYLTIINNKKLFDSKLDEYWARVDQWQSDKFGGKKIVNFSTLGGLDQWQVEDNTHPLNSRTMIDGNELLKFSFAWYCGADLTNCTKYFSKNEMKGSLHGATWGFGKLDEDVNNSSYYGSNTLLGWAGVFNDTSSWLFSRMEDKVSKINKELKIDITRDVLPKGFSSYIFKNSSKEGGLKISSIKNKMDFLIWKKFLNSKTMTQTHLKESLGLVLGEFEGRVWSEIIKIEGIFDKKYFNYKWSRTDLYSPQNASPELALMILDKVNSAWSNQFYRINILENIDFKGSAITPLELFANKNVQYAISNTSWNNQINANAFFTEDRFVKYLKELWEI